MSTRTNIVVTIGESRVYLYRHHDGYLAETGADLVVKLQAAIGTADAHRSPEGAADAFLAAIFAEKYEQQSYEKAPRRVYELTSDLHGDIEHAYFIDFTPRFNTGCVSIRHAARPKCWSEENLEVEDWTANAKRHSLDSFRVAVNKDREETNARIRKLKADNAGNKIYADMGEYPAIQAAA